MTPLLILKVYRQARILWDFAYLCWANLSWWKSVAIPETLCELRLGVIAVGVVTPSADQPKAARTTAFSANCGNALGLLRSP